MKDYTKEELISTRPAASTLQAISFCLNELYRDDTHRLCDTVTHSNDRALTYEELIGALLLAQDDARRRDGE